MILIQNCRSLIVSLFGGLLLGVGCSPVQQTEIKVEALPVEARVDGNVLVGPGVLNDTAPLCLGRKCRKRL